MVDTITQAQANIRKRAALAKSQIKTEAARATPPPPLISPGTIPSRGLVTAPSDNMTPWKNEQLGKVSSWEQESIKTLEGYRKPSGPPQYEGITSEEQALINAGYGVDEINRRRELVSEAAYSAALGSQDIITLPSGEPVDKAKYMALSPEAKQELYSRGITGYNNWVEAENKRQAQERLNWESDKTQLPNGDWVNEFEYNSLDKASQSKLRDLGVRGYQVWAEEQNAKAAAEEAKWKEENIEVEPGKWCPREGTVEAPGWNQLTESQRQEVLETGQYTVELPPLPSKEQFDQALKDKTIPADSTFSGEAEGGGFLYSLSPLDQFNKDLAAGNIPVDSVFSGSTEDGKGYSYITPQAPVEPQEVQPQEVQPQVVNVVPPTIASRSLDVIIRTTGVVPDSNGSITLSASDLDKLKAVYGEYAQTLLDDAGFTFPPSPYKDYTKITPVVQAQDGRTIYWGQEKDGNWVILYDPSDSEVSRLKEPPTSELPFGSVIYPSPETQFQFDLIAGKTLSGKEMPPGSVYGGPAEGGGYLYSSPTEVSRLIDSIVKDTGVKPNSEGSIVLSQSGIDKLNSKYGESQASKMLTDAGFISTPTQAPSSGLTVGAVQRIISGSTVQVAQVPPIGSYQVELPGPNTPRTSMGEYIPLDFWNSLSPAVQDKLVTLGTDKYNAWVDSTGAIQNKLTPYAKGTSVDIGKALADKAVTVEELQALGYTSQEIDYASTQQGLGPWYSWKRLVPGYEEQQTWRFKSPMEKALGVGLVALDVGLWAFTGVGWLAKGAIVPVKAVVKGTTLAVDLTKTQRLLNVGKTFVGTAEGLVKMPFQMGKTLLYDVPKTLLYSAPKTLLYSAPKALLTSSSSSFAKEGLVASSKRILSAVVNPGRPLMDIGHALGESTLGYPIKHPIATMKSLGGLATGSRIIPITPLGLGTGLAKVSIPTVLGKTTSGAGKPVVGAPTVSLLGKPAVGASTVSASTNTVLGKTISEATTARSLTESVLGKPVVGAATVRVSTVETVLGKTVSGATTARSSTLTVLSRTIPGVSKPAVKGLKTAVGAPTKVTVWEGVSVANRPIIGKTGSKFVLGSPKEISGLTAADVLPGWKPVTSLEARVIMKEAPTEASLFSDLAHMNLKSVEGGPVPKVSGFSEAELLKPKAVIPEMKAASGYKSPFLRRDLEYKATKYVSEEGQAYLLERTAELTKKGYSPLYYGSGATEYQLPKSLLVRMEKAGIKAADMDVMVNMPEAEAKAWITETTAGLEKIESKVGSKVTLEENLIQVQLKGDKELHHAYDFHPGASGSGAATEGAYGMSYAEKPIVFITPKGEKMYGMTLGEQIKRKGGSILGWEKGTFMPEAHRVPKDIVHEVLYVYTKSGEAAAEKIAKAYGMTIDDILKEVAVANKGEGIVLFTKAEAEARLAKAVGSPPVLLGGGSLLPFKGTIPGLGGSSVGTSGSLARVVGGSSFGPNGSKPVSAGGYSGSKPLGSGGLGSTGKGSGLFSSTMGSGPSIKGSMPSSSSLTGKVGPSSVGPSGKASPSYNSLVSLSLGGHQPVSQAINSPISSVPSSHRPGFGSVSPSVYGKTSVSPSLFGKGSVSPSIPPSGSLSPIASASLGSLSASPYSKLPSIEPSPSPSPLPSISPSGYPSTSASPSGYASASPSPSASASPSPYPSGYPSASPYPSGYPSPSPYPSGYPSASPSPSPSPSRSPSPKASPYPWLSGAASRSVKSLGDFTPGTLLWQQGELKKAGQLEPVWRDISPPYDQEKPGTTVGDIEGLEGVRGTPKETVRIVGGPAPISAEIDLGVVDVEIEGGSEEIRFKGGGLKTSVGGRSKTSGMKVRAAQTRRVV